MSGTITALLVIAAMLGILKGVSDSRQMRQRRDTRPQPFAGRTPTMRELWERQPSDAKSQQSALDALSRELSLIGRQTQRPE